MGIFEKTGQIIIRTSERAGEALTLLFRTLLWFRAIPKNSDKILRQFYMCGVLSIPVVSITAAFTGMILAGQIGHELKALGAEQMVGRVTGAAICRELGPVLTAVMVAGLVGGGMASSLGTMKVSEELDALTVMSIDPVRYLAMPRLVAMMIVLPVLTMYSNTIGILGGALVAKYQVGVEYETFFKSLFGAGLDYWDVWFGILKSFFFGVIISAVACDQGFSATGGAEGVGYATMKSVVYSFLLILLANFLLFSLVYR